MSEDREMLESLVPREILVTDDRPAAAPAEKPDPMEALGATLADHLAEQRRANEEFLRTLTTPKVPSGPLQTEIEVPGIDLNGLPDPSVPGNIEGFYAGLNARLKASGEALAQRTIQAATQKASGAANLQTTMARVADEIRAANPDLRDSWIDYASTQVGNALRARGLDPAQELMRRPDEIGQEILDYAEEEFLGAEEAPAPRARGGNRTRGITPGGARRPAAPAPKEEASTLIDDLKSWQTTNRMY